MIVAQYRKVANYFVICSCCAVDAPKGYSRQEAKEVAREAGWYQTEDGSWVCVHCAVALGLVEPDQGRL